MAERITSLKGEKENMLARRETSKEEELIMAYIY